jgi:death-on-curing protein
MPLAWENSPSPRWLSDSDLELLNQQLIIRQTPNEPIGTLNPSGLSSAQQRAAQYQHYTQTRDIFTLASVFAEAIVQNHPFFNANKRTAAAAVMVFLLINGWELKAPWHEVVDLFEGMARHQYSAQDLEHWLANSSTKKDPSALNIEPNPAKQHPTG